MAEKKAFLLRIDPTVFRAIERWASDELRSVNGQLEFILRNALKDQGRLPGSRASAPGKSARRGSHSR